MRTLKDIKLDKLMLYKHIMSRQHNLTIIEKSKLLLNFIYEKDMDATTILQAMSKKQLSDVQESQVDYRSLAYLVQGKLANRKVGKVNYNTNTELKPSEDSNYIELQNCQKNAEYYARVLEFMGVSGTIQGCESRSSNESYSEDNLKVMLLVEHSEGNDKIVKYVRTYGVIDTYGFTNYEKVVVKRPKISLANIINLSESRNAHIQENTELEKFTLRSDIYNTLRSEYLSEENKMREICELVGQYMVYVCYNFETINEMLQLITHSIKGPKILLDKVLLMDGLAKYGLLDSCNEDTKKKGFIDFVYECNADKEYDTYFWKEGSLPEKMWSRWNYSERYCAIYEALNYVFAGIPYKPGPIEFIEKRPVDISKYIGLPCILNYGQEDDRKITDVCEDLRLAGVTGTILVQAGSMNMHTDWTGTQDYFIYIEANDNNKERVNKPSPGLELSCRGDLLPKYKRYIEYKTLLELLGLNNFNDKYVRDFRDDLVDIELAVLKGVDVSKSKYIVTDESVYDIFARRIVFGGKKFEEVIAIFVDALMPEWRKQSKWVNAIDFLSSIEGQE